MSRVRDPFPARKKRNHLSGGFSFLYGKKGLRTREEGSTKFDHGRSPKSEFWNYRVSDKPVRVRCQPCVSKVTGDESNPVDAYGVRGCTRSYRQASLTLQHSFCTLFPLEKRVENPRRGFDKITRCTKCVRVILELSRKR